MRINDKYLPLWHSDKRYIIISGGRGSSKSYTLNIFLNQLLLEQGHHILFTRYTLTSAEKSIIPEFREKTTLLGFNKHFNITKKTVECNNGNILYFAGIKTSEGIQTAALKSIPNLTTWVVDEAEELPSKEIFDKIDESIRKKDNQNRVIIVLNPSYKSHWIYKEFFERRREDVEYIHTSYLDNIKNLNQSFIEKANKLKEIDITAYNHRYLGEWTSELQGRIYDFRIIKDYESLDYDRIIYGLDFGFNDPTAMVEVKIKERKAFIKQVIYRGEMLPKDIIKAISHIDKNSVIVADSARPDTIEEVYRDGFNIHGAKKYAGSKVDGIMSVKSYELFIDIDSFDLVKEIENYAWLQDRNGVSINKPQEHNDHLMDAIAYALHKDHVKEIKGSATKGGFKAIGESKRKQRVY